MIRRPPGSPLFPYPPLSRSYDPVNDAPHAIALVGPAPASNEFAANGTLVGKVAALDVDDSVHTYTLRDDAGGRSEEHTSELQSRQYLVCRLLLEKKKQNKL